MAITYHAGRRIQGLEYTASTLTTSGFAGTWGKDPSDSQFEVSNGKINFLDNTSSTGDRTWIDLQSIIGSAVSTTKWVLRFKFRFTTLTDDGTIRYYEFDTGLSDTTVDNNTNQNFIGVRVLPNAEIDLWRPRTCDGSTSPRTGATASLTQVFATNTDYYVEIKRTSASNWSISLSTTDAYDGDLQDNSYTDASGATGLRYFKFGDSVTNTGSGYTMQGVCDVFEFYNDTNTIATASGDAKPTNVQVGSRFEETDTRKMYYYSDPLSVDDDFSSTSGWTQNDSAKIGLDTSNDKLDFNIVLVGNDNAYRAITTGSTTWVMRYLLRFSTISTSSGSNIYFLVDISDDGTTAGNSSATGSIGLYMNVDESSNNSLDLFGNGATSDEIFVPVVNTDYYVEVIKTSATTATATVGTDSYGGTANGGSGSITGLTASTAQDTFAVRNRGTSSGSSGHSIIGYIKDFKYYNGVTSTDNVWSELGT